MIRVRCESDVIGGARPERMTHGTDPKGLEEAVRGEGGWRFLHAKEVMRP